MDQGRRTYCPHTTRCLRVVCRRIPGVADTSLFELGKYCSSLKRLNLGHCSYIKDAGVAAVAAGCPFLSYLRVSHCPDFTSKGIAVLSKRSK